MSLLLGENSVSSPHVNISGELLNGNAPHECYGMKENEEAHTDTATNDRYGVRHMERIMKSKFCITYEPVYRCIGAVSLLSYSLLLGTP